jgi:hypothetical protein
MTQGEQEQKEDQDIQINITLDRIHGYKMQVLFCGKPMPDEIYESGTAAKIMDLVAYRTLDWANEQGRKGR